MEYTPTERMKKLLAMAEADEVCRAAHAEIAPAAELLERCTDHLSPEEGSRLWAYPTALHTYHSRLLELVCAQMRFPEE